MQAGGLPVRKLYAAHCGSALSRQRSFAYTLLKSRSTQNQGRLYVATAAPHKRCHNARHTTCALVSPPRAPELHLLQIPHQPSTTLRLAYC